jgi:hypothetical protein
LASYYAIAAISQTILGVLADTCPKPEFAGARFELFQISDFQKEKPLEEGISLFLYRVALSSVQRNRQPHIKADNKRYRPPLPIDLYYLVSAWGRTAIQQQRLMGWCMRTLEDVPTLNATLVNTHGGPDAVFHSTESIDLIFEPLSMQDLANVWDLVKPHGQVSIAYVARMVYLDSSVELNEGRLVQTREFDMARHSS